VLFCLRNEGTLGIFRQERTKFLIRGFRLAIVAICFLHHAVMCHSNLHLRVLRFIEKREENDEVLIFLDSLGKIRGAALLVERIGYTKLGLGQVLAVGVGIDQGLKIQASFDVLLVLDILHRAHIQHFVRLGGIGGRGFFLGFLIGLLLRFLLDCRRLYLRDFDLLLSKRLG